MCAVLAFSFIFCTSGTVTEAKTAAYTSTITKDYRINWSNGTKKIYLNKKGNKLYCKNLKTGKTQLLKKLKIEADSDQSYMISYVYCGGYDKLQTFIETPWKIDRIEVIDSFPLK